MKRILIPGKKINEDMELLKSPISSCPFPPSRISIVRKFYRNPLAFVVNDPVNGNISVEMTNAARFVQITRMERTNFDHTGTFVDQVDLMPRSEVRKITNQMRSMPFSAQKKEIVRNDWKEKYINLGMDEEEATTKAQWRMEAMDHYSFNDHVKQVTIMNSYSYWCLWMDNYYCAQFGEDYLNIQTE